MTGAVLALSAVACVAAVVLMIKDEMPGDPTFVLLGVTELVLLVQLVVGAVQLSGTGRDVSGVLFVGYLVAVLLVLPVGAFWSLAERSRAGTAVLLLAAFAVLGLELRLITIWAGSGA